MASKWYSTEEVLEIILADDDSGGEESVGLDENSSDSSDSDSTDESVNVAGINSTV